MMVIAQAVLDARAAHPAATLADLYDPVTMPRDLAKAHASIRPSTAAILRPLARSPMASLVSAKALNDIPLVARG